MTRMPGHLCVVNRKPIHVPDNYEQIFERMRGLDGKSLIWADPERYAPGGSYYKEQDIGRV